MKNTLSPARAKLAFLILFYCLSLCVFPFYTAHASPAQLASAVDIAALAGIVIDADSGTVLYQKDADSLYPPASTAKILTALVVLEHYENMEDLVTFSREAVERVESDSGNKISVSEGDQLTVEDCLHAIILCSSNQSANALAEYIAGDIDGFAAMMNEKAKDLGLTSSHFENPSGLNSDTQNVTARELAIIAQAAYDNPKLLEISKKISYELPPLQRMPDGQTIKNNHQLVIAAEESNPFFYPPAVAGKTGYLLKAGNTLVTYAQQDNRRLISVVLKGQPEQYFLDTKAMLEFGFSDFENHLISEMELNSFSDMEREALKEHETDNSQLLINGSLVITLPKATALSSVQRKISSLPAGKHPAQAVAVLEYIYQDNVVGSTYIMAKRVLTENPPKTEAPTEETQDEIKPAGTGNFLFVLFIIVVLVIAAGLAGLFVYSRKKERQRMKEWQKQRRRRLREIGISPEEFEQLKKDRKNKP